jgi:hypothetical protein
MSGFGFDPAGGPAGYGVLCAASGVLAGLPGGGLEGQFSRAYSRNLWTDPLWAVIDHERATIASTRVAWCLGYEQYLIFLVGAAETATGRQWRQWEWVETKTAAVQLIKALAETGSIFIDGIPATAGQIRAGWETRFGLDLKDFEKLLYAIGDTKKDEAAFLTKLKDALLGRKRRLGK